MSDKKFTDEEVIKALEDYIKENEFEYFHSNMMGEYPLIRKSLDLINRQKAKVERYKRYYYRHEYDKWEKEIKTEAYQEFAKFLIDKSSKGLLRTSDLPDYVKEMAGN